MPAVISTLSPDNYVNHDAHHRLDVPIHWLVLFPLAAFAVVRFAAASPSLPRWTTPTPPGAERDRRKDYGRNVLAPPSGFPGLPARTGTLAAPRKHRLPFWPRRPMEGSRGVSSGGGADTSSTEDPPAPVDETRSLSPPQTQADGEETIQPEMDSWEGIHGGVTTEARPFVGQSFSDVDARNYMTRAPPPPMPPTFSSSAYAFEDRRPSYAVSIPPELDALSPMSFMHDSTSDYNAGAPSPSGAVSSPLTPRRRSYTKLVPIGIPSGGMRNGDAGKDAFAPSSFPSSAPILPPPPPAAHNHAHLYELADRQAEMEMRGEIITGVDESDAGWQRHTRVYGGGVCLACMAAGGGGFYGDKVPEEHKRPGYWHQDGSRGDGGAS